MKTSKQNLIQSLDAIEKAIKYQFKDRQLLTTAFTHSSYAKIHNEPSNERMEFLGDALLDFVVAQYLYENYPDKNEGEYTQVRSDVVDTLSLYREIQSLGLGEYLLVGNSMLVKDNDDKNKKLYADLYEALLCAIYFDGGLNQARRFIFDTLCKEMGEAMRFETVTHDFKTMLKEASEKKKFSVEYVLDKKEGTDNRPVFYYFVKVNGKNCGEGYGNSIREAQNYAAKRALKSLDLYR